MKASEWPLERLGKVCAINPRLPRFHGLADDDVISFVPMAAVNEAEGRVVSPQARPFSEVKKGYTHFVNGDVLFAKITPCMENGKAAIAQELHGGHGFGSTEFHVMRPGPHVLAEWIFYFVRRQAFRAEAKRSFTGTAGQQRVPTTFMESAILPVPPLKEQRRIVDILSQAEGILRLRREAQRRAAEIIPALFLDMFGDPATNPKGWPVFRLGDLAEVVSGVTKGRKFNGKETVTAPYLRVANVQAGFLDLTELKEIEVLPSEVQQLALQYGDILLTEGGDHDKLGRGALWIYDIPNCIHQNHIFRVRLRKNLALSEFFVTYLQTQHARNYFLRSAKRTTNLASINMTQLRGLPVVLPPLDTQAIFVKEYEQINSIKTQQETATEKAQATFDALLAKMFSATNS
jgi:type I restriction enzyme S subunit